MPCFHPLKAFRGRHNGAPVFTRPVDYPAIALDLPCGQCIGCRLERSRQWAVRCMHEASLHEDNCFITLTYDDAHLPSDGSLVKSDFQKFCKRLRKKVGPFRFFHCGEYGENFSRPHYHACIFGFDFPDRKVFKESAGSVIYTSALLEDVWSRGFCTVGNLTFESAAYVARYVLKKVNGDEADEHYMRVDQYGEIHRVEPEYVTMSRRPGIGKGWFERWSNEVYPCDEVVSRGFPARPPRYYDNLMVEIDPAVMEAVKAERKLRIADVAHDCTEARLRVREKCAQARVSLLRRPLDRE